MVSQMFSQMFAVDNLILEEPILPAMRSKATLKNISESLHLSISTVSRALKNHPDISEDTKRKVMELAALMEYEPNTYAINLRTNRSKTLGLMVPSISHHFYHSFISSVEEEARHMGYSLMILQSGDDPEVELENLRLCRINRIAGLFASISPKTTDIKPFLKLEESGIPVIFFDKVPYFEACNKVCVADTEAGAMAASAILEKNPRNILALFGNPDLLITQKRQQAFMETIASHPTAIPLTFRYAQSQEEARQQTLGILKEHRHPWVIFTMSDEILCGTLQAIQELQLRIPEDIRILSICNDGFIPTLFTPHITYVETSGYQLGKLAIKRLTDHMNGKTFVQEQTLNSRLVEGGTL